MARRSMIRSIDLASLREAIPMEETVPCPMCTRRHRFDLIAKSGMNKYCWGRFWQEVSELQALAEEQEAG